VQLNGRRRTAPSRRWLLAAAASAAAAPFAARASNEAIRVEIDTASAPQMAPWARRLEGLIAGWWPVITRALASPGYQAPDLVKIEFREIEPANVGAFSEGNAIVVNLADISAHPDDYGRVAHELAHMVQAYPSPNIMWLREGVADWVRYYVLMPDDPKRAFDPHRITYEVGYQPAAALLDFVERIHGAGSVRRVNAVMRAGGDGEAELLSITGATPFTLWRAYLKSLPPSG